MRGSLLDVNVLLALAHERHAHSVEAVRWLDAVDEPGSVLLCLVTQLGLLRLLTSPRILGAEAMTPVDAWATLDLLLSDDRFAYVAAPASLDREWRRLSRGLQPGASLGTDVYLASFAVAGGHELISFDSGFGRFKGLRSRILGP